MKKCCVQREDQFCCGTVTDCEMQSVICFLTMEQVPTGEIYTRLQCVCGRDVMVIQNIVGQSCQFEERREEVVAWISNL